MDWSTRLTGLLNVRYPIIQGGLAYLGYADLAAAVSNAGGLGQITAMSLPDADSLRQEIQRTHTLTDKPFGVNLALGMHRTDLADRLQVIMEENVPVVSITGGNPTEMLNALRTIDMVKLVLVSSRRQAQKAEQLGASAVIVVGNEGGGHLGRDGVGTMVLVPSIVDAVRIPVIASGGIGDGRGWMAAQALGAEGIVMGTRFIATQECVDASESYKQALVRCSETDTTIIKASIGSPGRVLRNAFAQHIVETEQRTPGYEQIQHLIRGQVNKHWIHEGYEEEGFGWAGQITGLIEDIPTVSHLISRMIQEAERIRHAWGSR